MDKKYDKVTDFLNDNSFGFFRIVELLGKQVVEIRWNFRDDLKGISLNKNWSCEYHYFHMDYINKSFLGSIVFEIKNILSDQYFNDKLENKDEF